MRNHNENTINRIYESSLKKLEENIDKGKLVLKAEKERKIDFKGVELNLKNHMNEMTKLVKEAKNIKTLSSNNIKDFYNSLIKCDELCDKFTTDEINKKINNIFDTMLVEINTKCKTVVL
ncbi:conserved Plasmodium protein, unknown function [Plasmodium vinckei lentum]|uniref:Uncharacterized protein n=1 Tax=Plasmodium vinckei lentum TaxID=138297 RepID=A0A6V7RUW4_PLAVN|nr:conserved Plasmodium protein, unknown function [Plasmodium vinckei lentum]